MGDDGDTEYTFIARPFASLLSGEAVTVRGPGLINYFTDLAGNSNTSISASTGLTVDNIRPTSTITASSTDVGNATNLLIEWSEDVTGFDSVDDIAVTATLGVSNLEQPDSSSVSTINSTVRALAQKFTTGPVGDTYPLSDVQLKFNFAPNSSDDFTATIRTVGEDGHPATTTHTLTNPSNLTDTVTEANEMRTFTALTRPCLLYTSPSPRDRTRSRMPSSA